MSLIPLKRDKKEWTHDNHSYDFQNENIYMRPADENDIDNMYQWEMESIDKSLQEDPKVQSLIRQDCYDSLKDTQMIMDGEHTIGMFTACMIDNGEWRYIGEIYIIPEYRGQGIGSTILKHEVENYDKLRLQVAFDNEGALRLYKSLGFKIVKENKEAKLYIMELDKTKALQEALSGVNASPVDDDFFIEAVLKSKERNKLKNGDFALVYKDKNGKLIRKYPVHDEAHVKAASKMFPRGVPDEYKERVARRILREAKQYNLDTSGWENVHNALKKKVSESYVERTDFNMNEKITKILEAYNAGVITQEEATEKITSIQESVNEPEVDTLKVKQEKIMESYQMGIINAKEGMQLIERVMMEADYINEGDDDDTDTPENDDNEPEDITPEDTDGDTVDSDNTNIDALADYINSLSDDEKTALMSKLSGSDEPTDDDANGNEEVPTDDATPAEGEPTTEETVDPASVSDASLNDANASLDDMEV